ncbi:MAG: hypothetical protein WBR15_02855 [Gammaproteobacteria bacterium]
MKYLSDILAICGALACTVAAALVNMALGCAVAGAFMLAFAALIAWTARAPKDETSAS